MIVLENEVLFSIFPVISTLKPMKMVRTEFGGHYILLVANKTNKKGIFHALDVQYGASRMELYA